MSQLHSQNSGGNDAQPQAWGDYTGSMDIDGEDMAGPQRQGDGGHGGRNEPSVAETMDPAAISPPRTAAIPPPRTAANLNKRTFDMTGDDDALTAAQARVKRPQLAADADISHKLQEAEWHAPDQAAAAATTAVATPQTRHHEVDTSSKPQILVSRDEGVESEVVVNGHRWEVIYPAIPQGVSMSYPSTILFIRAQDLRLRRSVVREDGGVEVIEVGPFSSVGAYAALTARMIAIDKYNRE